MLSVSSAVALSICQDYIQKFRQSRAFKVLSFSSNEEGTKKSLYFNLCFLGDKATLLLIHPLGLRGPYKPFVTRLKLQAF